jgi:hypothetical protein
MKLKLFRRMDEGKQIKIEFIVTEMTFSCMCNFTHACFDVDVLKKVRNCLIIRL